MIKRFPTKCVLCGHANTLRVTIGINVQQSHAFECQGCGEEASIELEIDFINREPIEISGWGKITSPRITNAKLENANWTEEEGTITNLDPTFLVPEEELHQDRVFPWMHAIKPALKSVVIKPEENGRPQFVDITDMSGMARGIREGISAVLKAIELNKRGRDDLMETKLAELTKISGIEISSIPHAIAVIASAILGKDTTDVREITALAKRAFEQNPSQFQEMRIRLMTDVVQDFLDRQLVVLKDYLRGYDHFNQAWFYAAKGHAITQLQPSARGLDAIRHFYGTAFEQLSSGLVLPACINNILSGRQFDQFENMDLKKYLTTDKAGRARCIEGRSEFAPLWNEFNSTLRNGSHHQGLRLKPNSKYVIQYRTGDSKVWQEITYSEYLVRCNRIQICLVKLLMLQMYTFGASSFGRT